MRPIRPIVAVGAIITGLFCGSVLAVLADFSYAVSELFAGHAPELSPLSFILVAVGAPVLVSGFIFLELRVGRLSTFAVIVAAVSAIAGSGLHGILTSSTPASLVSIPLFALGGLAAARLAQRTLHAKQPAPASA